MFAKICLWSLVVVASGLYLFDLFFIFAYAWDSTQTRRGSVVYTWLSFILVAFAFVLCVVSGFQKRIWWTTIMAGVSVVAGYHLLRCSNPYPISNIPNSEMVKYYLLPFGLLMLLIGLLRLRQFGK